MSQTQPQDTLDSLLVWGRGVNLGEVQKLIMRLNAARSEEEFNKIICLIERILQRVGIEYFVVDYPRDDVLLFIKTKAKFHDIIVSANGIRIRYLVIPLLMKIDSLQQLVRSLNKARTREEFDRTAGILRWMLHTMRIWWNSTDTPNAYLISKAPRNNRLIIDFGNYEIIISANSVTLWKL